MPLITTIANTFSIVKFTNTEQVSRCWKTNSSNKPLYSDCLSSLISHNWSILCWCITAMTMFSPSSLTPTTS